MAICKIYGNALKHNYGRMAELCRLNNAQLNIVSKFCLSNPSVIDFLYGAKEFSRTVISDSNMENFCNLDEKLASSIIKCVIKTRMSDIRKIPSLKPCFRPDRLFVSDMAMLHAVEELPEEMRPEIVLIAETGDLKDGFLPDEILRIADNMPTLRVIGLSVNFSCLSGILPDIDTVKVLAGIAKQIQKKRGLDKPFLSVGGTVVHVLVEEGSLNGLVQEIRSGEGIFFGYDSSGGMELKDFCHETISLEGEILEIADKDFALRQGHSAGFTATGDVSDKRIESGVRKRAVLDFGVLVANQKDLFSIDKNVVPAGQTFDFTVVDITDSTEKYATGQYIKFFTNYAAASFVMMNRYVPCSFIEDGNG